MIADLAVLGLLPEHRRRRVAAVEREMDLQPRIGRQVLQAVPIVGILRIDRVAVAHRAELVVDEAALVRLDMPIWMRS
jgi:hypothetical protein